MAVPGEAFLDAIAGISGKTAFEVWESGNNWSDIVKNAESVLGKQSKWNVLTDEAGNAFQIIGKNGKYINIESAAGAAENYIAGNQLVTDVIKEESGALTAYTGNILSETGEIRKKGLALGATTGAKVLGGVFAAFGAVMTGVQWYKDNPEFWTDLSSKLLPFGYVDPTDKSWGEIFQEALVPTAVDSDGNTYIPEDIAQEIANVLYEQGIFDTTSTVKIDAAKSDISRYNGTEFVKETALSDNVRSRNFLFNNSGAVFKVTNSSGYGVNILTGNVLVVPFISSDSKYIFLASDAPFSFNQKFITSRGDETDTTRVINDVLNTTVSYSYDNGVNQVYVIAVGGYNPYSIEYFRPFYNDALDTTDSLYVLVAALFFGIRTQPKEIDNVEIKDYPHPNGMPLSETYPDWYKNAVTSVNPDWNPSEPESDENPKYVTWIPLQFPDKDIPDGYTEPDTTPEDAQSGKPKPNTPVDPDTQTALNDGVLPNPYPNPDEEPSTNPSPQPQPQPQPTPEPTDPSDPGSIPSPDPIPGIPAIGGGSANALWKIYNPSQAILQAFGKWLWSTDPVKMIKELFSNNPAEGIVGLHMIYVTPPTGGTANIVVGYVDSGVASPWVSQQYVQLDCGSVTIPLRYQSALDFGYTKVYCYLPFIGIVPLDSFDVVGKTVHIRYTVDVLTGTVLAQISVSDGNYSAVLYTFNGSCSVEYPLTSGSRASQVLSLVTGAVGGAVVGGVGGALLGGARGALTGADVRMSGNISGNAGAMGIRKPYIIVKRPVEVAAQNYNNFYGYPANTTGRLSTFSGYTRVKDVHVENITGATADEKREIESLLKSGVIIN